MHTITEEFFEEAVTALHDTAGWKVEVDGKVKVLCKTGVKVGDHEYIANKMVVVVDLPLEELAEILVDVESRTKWDTEKTEKVQLTKVSENEDLIFVVGKSPNRLIMSPREMLTVRKLKQSINDQQQKVLQSVERSVEDEKHPVDKQGHYIRATVNLQAVELLELGPRQTQLKTISILNLGGWVPEWFIRKMTQLGANQFAVQIDKAHKTMQALKNK